jgi:4-amino-4-deoxy-L-arabinose transferase-like glycosyltransferase
MVGIGLAIRLAFLLVMHTYRFTLTNWRTFELANIAHSIATGMGFGSPFGGETGPSAWAGPLYPAIVALFFQIFGVFSHAAAFAIFTFNSIFSALTSWIIYRIGKRVFGETVAVWSGWIWTIFPLSIFFSVYWIWETTLSTFLLTVLFMLTLEMEGDSRLRSWILYGLLWAVEGLTNPSALLWLPFAGCWLAYKLKREGKSFVTPVLVSAVVFWLVLTPWMIRNYSVFGKVILIRGDFGVELRVGNNPVAQGWWVTDYHPGNNPQLYQEYRQIGEAAFDSESADAAKEWIAENPGRFVVLTLRRFAFYWAGIPKPGVGKIENLLFLMFSLLAVGGLVLAIKRKVHAVWLFISLMLSQPLIYYITFPQPRYRHPIEPEMLLLAVFLVCAGTEKRRVRRAEVQEGKPAVEEPERELTLVGYVVRGIAVAAGLLIVLVAFALFYNNVSLTHRSRAEFNAELDASLNKAIDWIAAHPRDAVVNPPLFFMVSDTARITNDPRLLNLLQTDVAMLHGEFADRPLTPFWERFANPSASLPFMTTADLNREFHDQRWFAYAIDPNRAHISDEDLTDLRNPDKYVWGARHSQVLALIMYKTFQGLPPDKAALLRTLAEKEARDQTYDFRVTDSYYQRNAFVLATGNSDLIRSRWIERILDHQNPDGSWDFCWYGWCRGIFDFGVVDYPHTTIQAAWALAQIKYRYPQWIDEHYK